MHRYIVTYIDETRHFKGDITGTSVVAENIKGVFEVLKSFGFNCNSIIDITEES